MNRALPLPGPSVLRLLCSLLLPVLLALAPPPESVELRDITVESGSTKATVTFLVTGDVTTVVVEPGKSGNAEIRMRPVRAGATALASATLKPGVKAVRAFIERRDVLITRATFSRAVRSMKVISRDDEKIVVEIELGAVVTAPVRSSASKSPPTSKSPSRPKSKPSTKPKAAVRPKAAAARPKKPAAPSSSAARPRWELTTIVIDAGHGGKDPGAIGLDGLQEKEVTLAVARRLRDELKTRMPGVKIIMTRDRDEFVELDRRGEIANRRGGRLFISIHCNSMPEKPHPVNGFECYILRPGKTDDAASITGQENSAVQYETRTQKYKANAADGTTVAGIAPSAFHRYSDRLARQISRELRAGTSLADRGIHQAGFYVLIGAAMPAVLIEIGYISSEVDIKLLKGTTGRIKIARSIARGIVAYQKSLTKK